MTGRHGARKKALRGPQTSRFIPHIHLPYSLLRLHELSLLRPPGLLQSASESLDGALSLDDGAALPSAELDEHRVDVLAERLTVRVGNELGLRECVVTERSGEQDVVTHNYSDLHQDVIKDVDQVEDRRHLCHEAILAVHDVDTVERLKLLAELVTDLGEGIVLVPLVEPAGAGVRAGRAVLEQHGVQVDCGLGAVDALQLKHYSSRHIKLSPHHWRGCLSQSERVFSYTHKMRCQNAVRSSISPCVCLLVNVLRE